MYKFTAKEKYNALKALRTSDMLTICRRYKVSRVTLWRWKCQYDGRIESLEPKFSRKHIHHPNEQTDEEKKNIRLCLYFGIEHKLIRPRTPRHNGKVERSHRNDNERFYRYLHYYSFDDLQAQMLVYLRRSNNIPTSVLRSKDDKRRWLSPNEKEKELLSS